MMIPSLTLYPILTQALESCTPVKNPDQIATKVMCNSTGRVPDATDVVLFVNTNPDSTRFGAWHAMAVGPNNTLKTIKEAEGTHLNDTPSLRMYPVACTEIRTFRNKKSLEGHLESVQAAVRMKSRSKGAGNYTCSAGI
jgi:hypothetical protein